MSDIALRFLLANLAAGAAILLVIALRKPARSVFGARLAYSLWLLVPTAALGSLLPSRIVEIAQPAPAMTAPYAPPSIAPDFSSPPSVIAPADTPALAPAQTPALSSADQVSVSTPSPEQWTVDPWALGMIVWLAGAVVMAVWLLRGQLQFLADARAGFAGPAVAGVFNPRIVTPADFEDRFEQSEREVILAHERIHLDNNDARINAFAALLRCLCWFNPLVHIAAHLMRIDQELACDAAVVERHPRARAVYANALLKAQLASRPLPLGCYWPAGTQHPLTERVEMLKHAKPTRLRRHIGIAALALLSLGASATAWAILPPEERVRFDDPVALDFAAIATAPADGPGGLAFDEPAPPPAHLAPDESDADYHIDDPVYLRGKVEKIDFGADTYIVYVRASSVARDRFGPEQPDTRLWRLAPMSYSGDQDAITRDLLNQTVNAGGFLRTRDALCDPYCAMKAITLLKCSATPTFSPGCSRAPDAAAPQPIRFEPQQSPPTSQGVSPELPPPPMRPTPHPVAENWIVSGAPPALDAGSRIYLHGKIEKIEFGDTTYVVFLRASSIARPYRLADSPIAGPAHPNADLWEFSPTNYFGNRDSIRADLIDKTVEANGVNLNKDCKPSCRINVNDLLMPRSSAVPPPRADESLINQFGLWYDTNAPQTVRGKVERIEFSEGTFDAYIRSEARGALPSRLYQVRSEYRFPRAEIEHALLGKTVIATGWRARDGINTFCDPVCGLYANDFTFPDRSRLTPTAAVLMAPSAYLQRPRGPLFLSIADLSAPVTVRGKILRYESDPLGENPQLWIEANSATPETTFGSKAGTIWVVAGFPFEPHETYDPSDLTRDLRAQAAQAVSRIADLEKRYSPKHPEVMKANQEKAALEARIAERLWVGRNAIIGGFNVEDKRCQPQCLLAGDRLQFAQ